MVVFFLYISFHVILRLEAKKHETTHNQVEKDDNGYRRQLQVKECYDTRIYFFFSERRK
jgi:hypothetical protein